MLGLLLIVAAHAGYPSPGQVTAESPHYDLERLYHEGRPEEGLERTRARIAEDPDDVDLYWHASRFVFDIGELGREDPSVDKVAVYQEMRDFAEAGLERAPDHPHLRFARGIAMGRIGTTRGVLSSLFMAKSIEQDWLAAAGSGYAYRSLGGEEQLPCDAQLCLGIFYRLVPDWWIVSVLAGTRGDLDKSVQWLEQAETCSPDDVQILKELGVARMCRAQRIGDEALFREGVATLHRVLALPASTQTERIDKEHVAMLLADPDLACEYSRDGQQDLDRAKLEESQP